MLSLKFIPTVQPICYDVSKGSGDTIGFLHFSAFGINPQFTMHLSFLLEQH